MMKCSFLLLFSASLMMMAQILPAEERKSKDDFQPPPPAELPLMEYIPPVLSPETGMWISSAGILTGMTLSLMTTHQSLNRAMSDPSDPKIQQNITTTGLSLITAAVCTVALDYFLDRIAESEKTISTE